MLCLSAFELYSRWVPLVAREKSRESRTRKETRGQRVNTVKARYNEGSRDWQNLFAIKRFRYIEVFFHIFDCLYQYWGQENRSLYRGFRYIEVRLYIEVSLYQKGSFSLVCYSLPLLMVSKEIIDKKKILKMLTQ